MASKFPLFSLLEELEQAAVMLGHSGTSLGSCSTEELIKSVLIASSVAYCLSFLGRYAISLLFGAIDLLNWGFFQFEQVGELLISPFRLRRAYIVGQESDRCSAGSRVKEKRENHESVVYVDPEITDAFAVLDLPVHASDTEIRAHFRRKIKAVHPDCSSSSAFANEAAASLIRAYRIASAHAGM
jgi:hypothetical protein